jgi:hypothetical protein
MLYWAKVAVCSEINTKYVNSAAEFKAVDC